MNELLQRVIKVLYDNDVDVYTIDVEEGITPGEAIVNVNGMYIRATKDSQGRYTDNVHVADIESETSEFVSINIALDFLVQALKPKVQEGDILVCGNNEYKVIKHYLLDTYNLLSLESNNFQLSNNIDLCHLKELIQEGKYMKK